jgi:hypothetical protein
LNTSPAGSVRDDDHLVNSSRSSPLSRITACKPLIQAQANTGLKWLLYDRNASLVPALSPATGDSTGHAETPNAAQDLNQVLGRALVAAYLVTGNLTHAEQAVLKAIEQWNPDERLGDDFLDTVLHEAAWIDASPELPDRILPWHCLPDELKAVLRLEPPLRGCFVLRNLVGLPSRDCARLLRMLPQEIDQYNVSALRRLALS